MSDPVTIVTLILAAIPTTIASVMAAMLAYLSFKKSTLTADMSSKTLSVFNGSMITQLKFHAKTARAKAEITKDAVDISVAVMAETMLGEYRDKMAILEERKKNRDDHV